MSTRRKSTVNVPRRARLDESPALELERLEQETTLVLQEIDHNLSHANAVINDRMIPILRRYASATKQVWTNVGFWKRFLEEAADVEISTADDHIEPPKISKGDLTSPTLAAGIASDVVGANSDAKLAAGNTPPPPGSTSTSSSDPRIEASTPQLRSRPLLLSSHSDLSPQVVAMRKASTGYLNVVVSPRKRTPKVTPKRTPTRTDSASKKRLSVLQNFLNSSPTLPEPPVLLSEVGRMAFASSSSVNRPTNAREPRDLLSDSDDDNLGALLPILFPTVSLTPGKDSRNRELGHSALSSGQRFPRTPTFGSARKDPHLSPVRRTPVPLGDYGDDSDLPVPKRTTAVDIDESDDLPPPPLQTTQITGQRSDLGDVPDLSKKRKLTNEGEGRSVKKNAINTNDDADNVFLDQNPMRNNSTIYHSIVEERETRSRSFSQMFEEVLQHSEEHHNNQNAVNQSDSEEEPGARDAVHDRPASGLPSSHMPAAIRDDALEPPIPSSTTENPQGASDTQHNLSHSLDHSNSSDLGSFLGERWKSLSRSLRKPDN